MSKTLEGILLLAGMIIGAGMFAIPFSFAHAGFLLGAFELIVLTIAVTLLHRFYGDIVLNTRESHRMPGYMRHYLGEWGGRTALASSAFGISGSLLAYLLIGSRFLGNLSAHFFSIPHGMLVLCIALSGALITFFPTRKEAAINGVLTSLLIIFIIFLIAFLLPRISFINLSGFHTNESFIPYGILLFALSGAVVIPDVVAVVGRNRRLLSRVVVIGTIVPAVIYFLFALAMVGSFGSNVSEDAISRLSSLHEGWLITLGSAIGFFAVYTSFIILSASFQALLTFDLGLRPFLAWVVGSVLPLLFYVAGFQNFVSIISIVGAVSIGLDSLLIILAHYSLSRRTVLPQSSLNDFIRVPLGAMIALGILFGIYAVL